MGHATCRQVDRKGKQEIEYEACWQMCRDRAGEVEVVTLHRRSDSKRAYRPRAFFFKFILIALIKQIKNKSRSY
jgi:hypothetical protein